MNIMKRGITLFATVAVAGCMFAVTVPAAQAEDAGSVVTSARSFPKAQTARTDLLAESVSTNVDKDTDWGGIESLDVPQTESQAEKDAEAAKAQAEAEAKAQAEAQAQAQASQSQAASRSSQRESVSESAGSSAGSATSASTGSGTGAEVAAYASQFVGYPYVAGGNTPSGWDCSGFVQYVFAQFGVSLPRTSGAQAAVGTAVASIAEAQPGDIIANGSHAAIYIGNGLVMNALNPSDGTQITGLSVFVGGYSIRRVL